MFSSRLPARLQPNVVTRALAKARADGRALIDLTGTNPTEVGIPYPPEIATSLSNARALGYRPDPRGWREAREAVAAAEPVRGGGRLDPERLILTASTSEAYAFLFKLLCDPGTAVLVPQPGYPLFDLLTALEGVRAVPYRLEYHGRWSIDRASIEAAAGPDVRAILVVSPNNPTGSCLHASDRDWLVAFAAERGLPLISDEVFADYPLTARPDAVSLQGEARVPAFTLGGLSKSAGLPQMKLAWIAVSGPEAGEALERLEVIADTYLSVSTPVQAAAPALLAAGAVVRRAIQDRIARNLAALRGALAAWPAVSLLEPEAGWSVVLRVPLPSGPGASGEEAVVLAALQHGVVVHPGYFFDFAHEGFVVLSLLPAPEVFETGVERLLRAIGESLN